MNGKAQITIDGQSVVLKFGMGAVRIIFEKMQQFQLITNEMYNELGYSHILYAGYVNACEMKALSPNISFERFYEYVEESDDEVVQREIISAIQAFEQSKFVKEAGKKKATPMNPDQSTGTT